MKRSLLIWLVALLLFGGCARVQKWLNLDKKIEKPAVDLAYEGMDAYRSGRYRKAAEYFQNLKDWYPFSKYAILAELKIPDARYKLAEYEEAVMGYEEFESLHPRNEAIPYVIYQIGRCHFDRIDTIDRDQSTARKALETFQRLIRAYPNDPYARKAEAHIMDCYRSLAAHEFYVGEFYFKSKHYKAALARFKNLITGFPDAGIHHQALAYIVSCEDKIREMEQLESETAASDETGETALPKEDPQAATTDE